MINSLKKIKVDDQQIGQRLDIFLAAKLNISRNKTQKIIKTKILINNKIPNNHYKLKINEIIQILKTPPDIKSKINTPPKITIISEEKNYIIIDKPVGLVVHPDSTHTQGNTLIDQLLLIYPDIQKINPKSNRPGIVHRLDKNVSGVMVVAKNKKMQNHLKSQFKMKLVDKKYKSLVYGHIYKEKKIETFLSRGAKGKIQNTKDGRSAVSLIKPLKLYTNSTLLEVSILTGRTHQIKVHLLGIGNPIVGERLYSNKKSRINKLNNKLDRPFLHAETLKFINLEGIKKEYHSKLTIKLENFLKELTKLNTKDRLE